MKFEWDEELFLASLGRQPTTKNEVLALKATPFVMLLERIHPELRMDAIVRAIVIEVEKGGFDEAIGYCEKAFVQLLDVISKRSGSASKKSGVTEEEKELKLSVIFDSVDTSKPETVH